ncbi:MAG: AAA family ATPase, partial [Chromatiales bacterium]|nr:AAA family ATPase [Chromatiales bacterium]
MDDSAKMATAADARIEPRVNQSDPFQTYCEAAAYFPEVAREQALKLLAHLAPYSDLLLVTGVEGVGKSLFLSRFALEAAETWRVLSLRGGPAFDNVALIEELERAFSVRSDVELELSERVRRLRRNLQTLRRGALQPILVMDDAHMLPRSAFVLFMDLTEPREEGDKLLGIVLCGETDALREKLALEEAQPLQARIAHTFELAPLSEADTAAYIFCKLTAAGCPEQVEIFTPAVIRFIRTASRGLPGRINDFARNLLQERTRRAQASPSTSPAASDAGTLLRYGVSALVLALLAIIYLYPDRFEFIASPADTEVEQEASVPAPDELISDELAASEMDPRAIDPDADSLELPADLGEGANSEAAANVDADENLAASASEPVPAVIPVPESTLAATDPTLLSVPAESGDKPAATDLPRAGAVAQVKENVAENQQANNVAAVVKAESKPKLKPVVPSRVAASVSAAPASSASALPAQTRREAWLLSQPGEHFTLQLLASNEARLLGFIKEHGLQDQAAIFLARAGDQPLYAVTWGVFPNRSEAVLAAESAKMRAIRGVKPWVRPLRDIHGLIAAAETAVPAESPAASTPDSM